MPDPVPEPIARPIHIYARLIRPLPPATEARPGDLVVMELPSNCAVIELFGQDGYVVRGVATHGELMSALAEALEGWETVGGRGFDDSDAQRIAELRKLLPQFTEAEGAWHLRTDSEYTKVLP